MIEGSILKKALTIAVEKKVDYADIFAEKAKYNWIISDDRKLKTDFMIDQGVGMRVVSEGRTYYAITDSFEEKAIFKLAKYVRDAASGESGIIPTFDLRERKRKWDNPFKIPPAHTATERKLGLIKEAEEKAWSTPHSIQATIRYQDHQRDIVMASTFNNSLISHSLGLTEFSVLVLVEKDGVRESGAFGRSFYGGLESLTGKFTPTGIAGKAADMATIMLTAKDCPRGEMPVVFAPGDNGILFHESCGHGMEADIVEKGSNFAGMQGKQVASPDVTLIDDGTLPGYPGSFEFDDEGTPSQSTVMIKDGVLQNYLHSSITARKMKTQPTGSARRESYKYPPIPRMRNTYILGGSAVPKDIIRDTKRGLYAVNTGGGGQVNPITGEFITSIKLGYLIENGKITIPVRGASIIGRGIDALRNIDLIGNDLEIAKCSGRCGKGQSVPVGVGMPTVRVKSLMVGGTGEAFEGDGK